MELVSELLGILERQNNLLDDLSKGGGDLMVDKNIIKSPNSTFSKKERQSDRLSSSEKKRVAEFASIFLSKSVKDKEKIEPTQQKTILKEVAKPIKKTEDLFKLSKNKSNTILKEVAKPLSKKIKGKDDESKLSSNGRSRYTEISKIFTSVFFNEQKKNKRDTALKTSVTPKKGLLGNVKGELVGRSLSKDKPESLLSKIFNSLIGGFGIASLMKLFKGKILSYFKKILSSTFSKIYKGLKSIVSSLINSFKKGFSFLYNKIKNSKIFGSLKKTLAGFKNVIASKLNSLWKGLKNTISSITGKIKNITSKVAAPVLDKGKSLLSKGGSVIGSKASSIWKGIKSIGGSALKATGKAASTVLKAGKTLTKNVVMSGVNKAASGVIKGSGGIMKVMGKLKGIPVLGPAIYAISTGIEINKLKRENQEGKLDLTELQKRAGKTTIQSITGLLGASGGAALGGIVGSVIPVAGNIIGGITGGILGDMAGRFIGDVFSKYVIPEKYIKSIGAFVTGTTPPSEEMQDFIVKNNKVYRFSRKDEILGMKQGGPINQLVSSATPPKLHKVRIVQRYSTGNYTNQNSPKIRIIERYKMPAPRTMPSVIRQRNTLSNYSNPNVNRIKSSAKNTQLSDLISVTNTSNDLLRAIVNNTAMMTKNMSNSSTQPIIVANSSNPNPTSSKKFVNIDDNRFGYANSPYSL